jgi:hypothetical protein
MATLPSPTMTHTTERRPYAPSWVEALIDAIKRLPVPKWVFYPFLWVVLFLLQTFIKWSDGTYPVGEVSPTHALLAAVVVAILVVTQVVDYVGEDALNDMRPALIVDEAEFRLLCYQLTTAPAKEGFIASLVGIAALIVWVIGERDQGTFEGLQLFTSPLASVVDGLLLGFVFASIGVAVFGSLHMLGVMRHIYDTYIRVDLFFPTPLYGFSRVTAFLGISMTLAQYAWLFISPGVLDQPFGRALAIFVPMLASAVFLIPLLGIHRQLVDEKARRMAELAESMDNTIMAIQRTVRGDEAADLGKLSENLSTLNAAEQRLAAIPTWPWNPETPRLFASALLLPIILWFMQSILQRFLGP